MDEIIIDIAYQIKSDLMASLDIKEGIIADLRKEHNDDSTFFDKILDTINQWDGIIKNPASFKNLPKGEVLYFTLILILAPPKEYPKIQLDELKRVLTKKLLYD